MRPVLSQFTTFGKALVLNAPASARQANGIIKNIGIVVGHISRIVSHDLRRSAIRDVAHLGKNAPSGPSTNDVRKYAGHAHKTMENGVLDTYVGPMEHDFFSRRAELTRLRLEPVAVADPKAFHDTIEGRITTEEYEEELKSSFPNAVLGDLQEICWLPIFPFDVDDFVIDPRLLGDGEDGEDGPGCSEEVQRLTDTLLIGGGQNQGGDQDQGGIGGDDDDVFPDITTNISPSDIVDANEAAAVLLENLPDVSTTVSFKEWINTYARYNVVTNFQLASVWGKWKRSMKTETDFNAISQYVQRGNARDEVTVFEHTCPTPGCNYKHWDSSTLSQHKFLCEQGRSRVAGKAADTVATYQCSECPYQCATEQRLKHHVRITHKWKPRTCPDCPDGPVYEKYRALEYHRRTEHTLKGLYPTQCTFAGCTTTLSSESTLRQHLDRVHQLHTTDTRAPYVP
ncbi:hypothetical protein DM02DRAFT_647989 [Periconia macrospinosa]|uniref:C2H2-type domain-containing protein n=1 Tax=Periconia macrospinosa TaxID=97972 RepID=A0A2V1EF11_9PLEO|nr:hypothetical protein DM02DRAFT_647989 [Periconia macrospinosa]